MATKTISIDVEAYERLSRARRTPNESFSRVIHRARWDDDEHTARALLERCRNAPLPEEEELRRLDEAQRADRSPGDPWRSE
jgi:predicted CopG family antitoxin